MSDAIELLEAIGQDASLRYASAETLMQTLQLEDTPEALRAAAASGNMARLAADLGRASMHATHHSQTPGHEEQEEPDEEDPGHAPEPEKS